MLEYLLKSGACLLVFFSFYKLLLENERFLSFKRFYLLGMIVLSLVIPLITFSYTTTEPAIIRVVEDASWQTANTQALQVSFWEAYGATILISLYLVGFLFFLARFIRNFRNILEQVKNNEHLPDYRYIYVLLKKRLDPHSFLNYIFLNRSDFQNEQISEAVLEHEKAHVDQKHSLDLIFIEIIQVIFWFNPLIFFIKRSAKLNHEFLADEQVLKGETSAFDYSNILYQYTSRSFESSLSSSISHSLIKKRIIMITKEFSRKRFWLRLAIFIPVTTMCLYLFNNEIVAKPAATLIAEQPETMPAVQEAKTISVKVEEEDIWLNGKSVKLKNFAKAMDKLTSGWTTSEMQQPNFNVDFSNSSTPFINKLNAEYKKSKLAQVSGIDFMAPPAPPAPSGNMPPPPPPARGENAEVAPPPPPKPAQVEVIEVVEDNPAPATRRVIEVIEDDEKLREDRIRLIEIREERREEMEQKRQELMEKQQELAEMRKELRENEELSKADREKAQSEIDQKQAEMREEMAHAREKMAKVRQEQREVARRHMQQDRARLRERPPHPPAPPRPEQMIDEIESSGGSFYLNGKKSTADEIRKVVKTNKDININVHKTEKTGAKMEVTTKVD